MRDLKRRDLLSLLTLLPSACSVNNKGGGFVRVEEATIENLQAGGATATQMVEAYLQRIQMIDRSGPSLNSVIEVNPDALTIAAELDRKTAGKGILHGIPILVKDNIDTADRMRTTAGSLAMMDAPTPREDAPVVARLREAGAVILGKTNLSEWANIRSPRATSAWSGRGGQTRNPYALDRNPSGSSSGSGAAAAASLCAVAIGTETDGSIVSPASINGLVGIKPTVGLLSSKGIIPISHTQDTAGPMARTVRDAAMVLSVMAGKDYGPSLNPMALRGARIGVVRQLFGNAPGPVLIAENAMQAMREAGAEIIDPVEIPTFGKFDNEEFLILLYELKADLNAYLQARGGPMKSLADVIAYNAQNAAKEMPYFAQETFEKAQAKGGLDTPEYREAIEKCRRMTREEGIDAAMKKHNLDALFCPTDSPAWPTDWVTGDHFTGGNSPQLPAVAGYPHITVPGGLVWGLPVGVSFFGTANSESRLLGLAYAFEQKTRARRKPRYLATVEYAPK